MLGRAIPGTLKRMFNKQPWERTGKSAFEMRIIALLTTVVLLALIGLRTSASVTVDDHEASEKPNEATAPSSIENQFKGHRPPVSGELLPRLPRQGEA